MTATSTEKCPAVLNGVTGSSASVGHRNKSRHFSSQLSCQLLSTASQDTGLGRRLLLDLYSHKPQRMPPPLVWPTQDANHTDSPFIGAEGRKACTGNIRRRLSCFRVL